MCGLLECTLGGYEWRTRPATGRRRRDKRRAELDATAADFICLRRRLRRPSHLARAGVPRHAGVAQDGSAIAAPPRAWPGRAHATYAATTWSEP